MAKNNPVTLKHALTCPCGRNLTFPATVLKDTVVCRCGEKHMKQDGIEYKEI